MKITFLGGGNMANALISGLLKQGAKARNITVVEIDANIRERLSSTYGVCCLATIDASFPSEGLIILAVKPQQMQAAITPLVPYLSRQIVVSIAAGLRLDTLSRWLGAYRCIVRAMPNTPCLINAGMTGLFAFPEVSPSDRQAAENALGAVGETLWLSDEKQMDALTAISGSGPAYVFLFIEALQQAGLALGFNKKEAEQLALATFAGATRLATQSQEDVSLLRQRVTSKGGTTEAAIHTMIEGGIDKIILSGVEAAQARSIALGSLLDDQTSS